MRLEHRRHCRDVARGIGREVVDARIVDPAPGILEVVHVVSETAKTDQVMQELEGDTGQGIPEDNSEDDDLALARPAKFHGGAHSLPSRAGG
jgi:hypothetical protein